VFDTVEKRVHSSGYDLKGDAEIAANQLNANDTKPEKPKCEAMKWGPGGFRGFYEQCQHPGKHEVKVIERKMFGSEKHARRMTVHLCGTHVRALDGNYKRIEVADPVHGPRIPWQSNVRTITVERDTNE